MKLEYLTFIGSRNRIKRVWRLWNRFGGSIIFGSIMLNQDFNEFIKSLNDNQVRLHGVGDTSVRIQAAQCLGPISISGGFAFLHSSIAMGHRVWNLQPEGGFDGMGRSPERRGLAFL